MTLKVWSYRSVTLLRRALLGATAGLLFAGTAALSDVIPPAEGESLLADSIRASGVFRAGIVIAPPALLEDPSTGELVGPSMVVARAIADGLGVELRPVRSTWDTIIAGVQADTYDIAVAPLFATDKRLEVVDMVTYYKEGLCYLVPKNHPVLSMATSIDALNSPDIRMSVVTGTAGEAHVRARFPKAQMIELQATPGGAAGPEAVASGRADAAYIDSTAVRLVLVRFPQMTSIPGADECIANPDAGFDVGVAFRKGDTAMHEYISALIEAVRPEIDAAMAKYTSPGFLIRE